MNGPVFLDIEATSKFWSQAEIVEIFITNREESHLIQIQPNEWSEEAEEIHKISLEESLGFQNKKNGIAKIVEVLKDVEPNTEFVMYTNVSIGSECVHYDMAVLKYELMNGGYTFPNWSNITSVHSMAKEAAKKNLFTPISNKESGRKSYRQEDVFEAIFGHRYDSSHRAKSDTINMIKIYDALKEALENNKPVNISQTSMFNII